MTAKAIPVIPWTDTLPRPDELTLRHVCREFYKENILEYGAPPCMDLLASSSPMGCRRGCEMATRLLPRILILQAINMGLNFLAGVLYSNEIDYIF